MAAAGGQPSTGSSSPRPSFGYSKGSTTAGSKPVLPSRQPRRPSKGRPAPCGNASRPRRTASERLLTGKRWSHSWSGASTPSTTAGRPRKGATMRRDELPADGKLLLLGVLDFEETEVQGWPVKRLYIRVWCPACRDYHCHDWRPEWDEDHVQEVKAEHTAKPGRRQGTYYVTRNPDVGDDWYGYFWRDYFS